MHFAVASYQQLTLWCSGLPRKHACRTYEVSMTIKGTVMASQINVSACLDLISGLRTGSLCECIHLEAPHWIFMFTMERLKPQF